MSENVNQYSVVDGMDQNTDEYHTSICLEEIDEADNKVNGTVTVPQIDFQPV